MIKSGKMSFSVPGSSDACVNESDDPAMVAEAGPVQAAKATSSEKLKKNALAIPDTPGQGIQ